MLGQVRQRQPGRDQEPAADQNRGKEVAPDQVPALASTRLGELELDRRVQRCAFRRRGCRGNARHVANIGNTRIPLEPRGVDLDTPMG